MPPRIAIHGHFYQPPRENPWTALVERQPSAAPDHDWNIRIANECYLPNLRRGNLSKLSFNFGPTLLSWADRCMPEISAGVAASDRAARERDSRGASPGPAIAQLFSHPIAPLLRNRDLYTQIRWGSLDFERRFGRRPEGMWLPECAVDLNALRALADQNIQFTILSPAQAKRISDRPGVWRDAGDGVDVSSKPARVDLGDGRFFIVFFYDLHLSQSISFGDSLDSPAKLVDALKRAALARTDGDLVFVATDGETFGHHKKGGADSLASALEILANDPDVELTTVANIAAGGAPSRIVELHEPSAWSCSHGVGRWKTDCGCRMAGGQQRWRAPLREAVELLTNRIHTIFATSGAAIFKDPWDARDRSAGLPPDALANDPAFVELLQFPDRDADRRAALRLLEMERQCLFAHTSCGWFFDDIAGIEPVQNLRCAARAIELSGDGAPLEDLILTILRRAPSDDPKFGDGSNVYKRLALPAAQDGFGIAARAALRWLFDTNPADREIAFCNVSPLAFERVALASRVLATGIARVERPFDQPEQRIAFAAVALADGECFVYFTPGADAERVGHASAAVRASFETGRITDCLKSLTRHYPTRQIHLLDLGDDEREEIARLRMLTPPA
ncbi:MAG: DUF3536 domain-containing protein [Planctomycetes bacterium]|nr:DUF3536 domain-containing protein [Planctomycetota bacterium]